MGFMDDLENKVSSGAMGGSTNPLVGSLLQMIQNQPGGLQGLVQNFHEKGLGGLVQSWVTSGQNLPISGDQVNQVLGSDAVRQMAAKAGISPETASSALSTLLPQVVDKLTPNGQVPEHGDLMSMGASILKSLGTRQS